MLIVGTIPSEIANLNLLESYDVSYNYLTGTIPIEFIMANRLRDPRTIRFVSYNCLSGLPPPTFYQRSAAECASIPSSSRTNPPILG